MLFLLFPLFTVCQAFLDCLSSIESLILLIWSWMYSIYSFRYALISSLCAFSVFWALTLVGFLLLYSDAVFTSSRFANVSQGNLYLALSLVGMLSAVASMWALTKFSYSSFGVSVSDILWIASNLFLSFIVYFSQISPLLNWGQP